MTRGGRARVGTLAVAVGIAVSLRGAPPARAILGIGDFGVFHDPTAFIQRMTQFATAVAQLRAIVKGAREQVTLLQNAYAGLKNWRNLGWIDTLDIIQSPWFDQVEGIDDMRAAVLATSLSADQVQGLWGDLKDLHNWKEDPRYGKDFWFRMKIRALLRESQRARQVRTALFRQIKLHNKALTRDIARMKNLRGEIEKANTEAVAKKIPVDAAKVASLQAELTALEGKYQSEDLMLKNQRALMFMMGEDDAHQVFMDLMRDAPTWRRESAASLSTFGAGFRR
jgi:hypothetical protein